MAEIRQDARLQYIPMVILTGSMDSTETADIKRYSVSQYIVKPHDLDGYIILMHAILEGI
jgi:CheY-like chemotaxis protein